MQNLFNTILYYPIFNLLVYFYNLIPDIGVAIIFVTIIVKIAIWPISKKSIKSQKAMQSIQPKLEALKLEYKDNQQELAKATMQLYKTEGINPLSSCLPLLIQFPIMIAVFYAFRNGLVNTNFDFLYGFVKNPGTINATMFGFLDLAKPQWILGALAGVAQYFQTKMLMQKKGDKKPEAGKEPSLADTMSKQMLYFMPFLTVFISLSLPGGLALYFLVITLLGIVDTLVVTKLLERKNKEVELLN